MIDTDSTEEIIDSPGENGWRRHRLIVDGDSSSAMGDDAVGRSWDQRYFKQLPDGTWAIITDVYYVEQTKTYNQPEVEPAFVVTNRTEYVVCTDVTDLGSTELYTDYEYEDGSAFFYSTLASAEAEAERLGSADWRHALLWSGRRRY